ncbi:MAG: hypothetical protein K6G72_01125 [Lachnospiraceae bacterium]|nr:hypothetical protein [Lachnospiraceae bacterium]
MHKFFLKTASVLCAMAVLFCGSLSAHADSKKYVTERAVLQDESNMTEHGMKTEFKILMGKTQSVGSMLLNNKKEAASPNIFSPNWIIGSITPQASSYLITFTNVGLDTVDSLTMKLTVKKDNGTVYANLNKTFYNLKVGTTSHTWSLAKGSVQETIYLTGTASDGGQTITLNNASTERWNFAGGQYGTMQALDGQRHHMPSDSVSPLSTYKGPCVRMRTADHKATSSYGSGATAVAFRAKESNLISQGKFLGAQNLGISDLQSRFGSKYNYAINDMVAYTKSLGYTQ